MFLVSSLVYQTVLTTRLAPPPARISLDGGYQDILVSIQPEICSLVEDRGACAKQFIRQTKVSSEQCSETDSLFSRDLRSPASSARLLLL